MRQSNKLNIVGSSPAAGNFFLNFSHTQTHFFHSLVVVFQLHVQGRIFVVRYTSSTEVPPSTALLNTSPPPSLATDDFSISEPPKPSHPFFTWVQQRMLLTNTNIKICHDMSEEFVKKKNLQRNRNKGSSRLWACSTSLSRPNQLHSTLLQRLS